jgi:transcription antitermination factor NusA-like protein
MELHEAFHTRQHGVRAIWQSQRVTCRARSPGVGRGKGRVGLQVRTRDPVALAIGSSGGRNMAISSPLTTCRISR